MFGSRQKSLTSRRRISATVPKDSRRAASAVPAYREYPSAASSEAEPFEQLLQVSVNSPASFEADEYSDEGDQDSKLIVISVPGLK
jgi:hypothetical protein